MSDKEKKPTTVLFIRHGENDWTETHKLAGRSPNVHLNEYGQRQAVALGQRLAHVALDALYASPLERTIETATEIANHQAVKVTPYPAIIEVDYGEWTGKPIKELAQKDAWKVVQFHPSGARFPGGESMYAMQARFVQEVNRLVQQHPEQTIALVGHADLIKSAVAHYLGVHLDLFQRIVISTASITTITFHDMGPRVMSVNDTNHNPVRPKEEEKGA